MTNQKNQPIVIVGAGIAGASTAYALTRRGVHDIVLVEKEAVAGMHSTGRNAAILRTLIPDPHLYALACESKNFLLHPPDGFADAPLVRKVGVFLAAPDTQIEDLGVWAAKAGWQNGGPPSTPELLYGRIPALAPGIARVFHSPDEGVVDVDALHQGYLKGAREQGAELRLNCRATRILTEDGRITRIETGQGTIETSRVVLAAGGWGDELAAEAGCPLPLVPRRRHLMVTSPIPQVDPDWPVVWIMGDEFYFRPESGGLLLCACDTVGVPAVQGENTDPQIAEKIAVKAARWLPSFADAGAARLWAGMRTFSADQHFVLGADPRLAGLFWAAGLGGHGITCSAAVGAVVAEWVTEGRSTHPTAPILDPARLLRSCN
jgi:D-arginine dehydrogenase